MIQDSLSHFRHRVRNHLNTISVNAELLKLLTQGEANTNDIARCVERILNECKICAADLQDTEGDSGSTPLNGST